MIMYHSLITILIFCGVQSMKNGRQADNIEFPFVVSIQYNFLHLCSGIIIDNRHILTVAHPIHPYSTSDLLVVLPISVVRWPYHALTVKTIYLHPFYQEFTPITLGHSDLYWENDIAILELKESVPSTSTIGLVSVSPTNFEAYRCFECIMISWSYPNENDLESVVLMWDVVYMVDNTRCEQWGIHVLANQQCFIDLFETAFISAEDLGSPIICGGSLVGMIVKEARQGEATSPTTFLSTFNYIEFILEIISGGEINAPVEKYPYMVSIWRDKRHVCGGVIVNAYHVVTAGQCIRSASAIHPIEIFRVAAGSDVVTLFDRRVQWYRVTHLQVHPHYLPTYNVDDLSWRIEHDIGLITLSTPFSWSPTVQSVRFADADFSIKQLCQVLHWTSRNVLHKREYRQLMQTTAVLINDKQLLEQLEVFQIAAKELYAMNNARPTDIGNPIICGGHPIGIMVRIHRIHKELRNSHIIFLRIHPYDSMGFFEMP